MKIIEEPKQNGIPISEMNDGDIAVITDWDGRSYHIGTIVQRYGDDLITVSMPLGNGWGCFFKHLKSGGFPARVRILPRGTKLEI
jgi:hypothetical protein